MEFIIFIIPSGITGGIIAYIVDRFIINRYGHPLLSIAFAKLYGSKRWRWLMFNLWGDDSLYYAEVLESLKSKYRKEQRCPDTKI